MLQAFVITLREGLEAFLIVAISLAYLKKTGRHSLLAGVYWGIGASLLISLVAAWGFHRASNQPLWEGVLAIAAAVLVASLIVHMWRAARHMRQDIHDQLERSAAQTGVGALLGVFGFTVLMITREGMETVLLMNALIRQVRQSNLVLGALAGIAVAALLAWMWSRYGHRVHLGLFFQVTAIFLAVFVVQLLIYGVHELSEAHLFPASEQIHAATEAYGPDGRYGKWLSYSLVLLPGAWLLWTSLRSRRTEALPST